MRLLEIVFVLIAAGFLVAQNRRGVQRKHLLALLAAGIATLALSALLGQMRWQMAPAYLVFAVLSLLLLKRSHSRVAIRSAGVLVGIVVLAIGLIASLGLPIVKLPAPNGPYIVGSTSLSLLDESRDNSLFGAPDEKRELYVQIWYPGTIAAGQPPPRVKTFWAELYRGDLDRFTVFSRYLREVKTHSFEDIELSSAQASYPVIVFTHAMGSFAEQNTLLMEHLASHGYVVFGVSHPYTSGRAISSEGKAIYPNFAKINEASAESAAVDEELAPRIERATSPEDLARLHVERFERPTGLSELMKVSVDDLGFVIDSIGASPTAYPKLRPFANRLDVDRIGLLGMSFGGGAVTEFCKADTRCRAALNMDGGTYGRRQREPLQIPYLAMVSEGGHFLDYLLPASRSDYYRVEVRGSAHLDFTDDPMVLPILKWAKISGAIAAERMIEIINAVSLRFFDAYLRGAPHPRFDGEFPELTVQTNESASRPAAPPPDSRESRDAPAATPRAPQQSTL